MFLVSQDIALRPSFLFKFWPLSRIKLKKKLFKDILSINSKEPNDLFFLELCKKILSIIKVLFTKEKVLWLFWRAPSAQLKKPSQKFKKVLFRGKRLLKCKCFFTGFVVPSVCLKNFLAWPSVPNVYFTHGNRWSVPFGRSSAGR